MDLNENQKKYIAALALESGLTTDDAAGYIEEFSETNNTMEIQNLLVQMTGNPSTVGTYDNLVKLGNDDSWLKKQQETNAKRLENIKSVGGSNTGLKLPDKLPALENERGNIAQEAPANSLLEEYGNNYFELITYDYGLNNNKNNGELRLAGVLKDIPSFSMSTTWDKGPAASISDTVKGFMTSPLCEMATTLGGRDRAWMNLDEGTDRTYKTTSRPTFDLTFKIYPNEQLGSQPLTTYKTWLKALSLYTMPSVDAKVNINAMANNTLNGIYGCAGLIGDAVDAFKDTMAGEAKTGEKDANGKDITDKTDAGILSRLGDAVMKTVNTAAGRIQERDDEYRVGRTANTKNFYGAKLWYLKIMPGIFKNPLIVYISNWSVTYSKEINPDTGEPISIEFKLNCEMDQVASAPVWMKYLCDTISPNLYD